MSDDVLKLCSRLFDNVKVALEPMVGAYDDENVGSSETGDATYEVDVPIEAAIEEFFKNEGLDAKVITEDKGELIYGSNPQYTFLIDPLDGSRNARRNLPFYCFSIAVYEPGADEISDASHAMVARYDKEETFTAIKGGDALLNGKTIEPSRKEILDDSVIALGSHFTAAYQAHADIIASLSKKELGVRDMMIKCLGASALELCYVAAGRMDALIDLRSLNVLEATPKTYDFGAALLIARQAGVNLKYGSKRLGEPVPIDPKVGVSMIASGSDTLFTELTNSLMKWQ